MSTDWGTLNSLGIIYGFSDSVQPQDITAIEEKAEEIMSKAKNDLNAYLDSLGYESCMGLVRKKE